MIDGSGGSTPAGSASIRRTTSTATIGPRIERARQVLDLKLAEHAAEHPRGASGADQRDARHRPRTSCRRDDVTHDASILCIDRGRKTVSG